MHQVFYIMFLGINHHYIFIGYEVMQQTAQTNSRQCVPGARQLIEE